MGQDNNEINQLSAIKILLIDDHSLFRNGLAYLLNQQDEFIVVGEASDGLEGTKLVAQLQPDVVLLDLDMPVMNGKEALLQILSAHPELCVLMLTVSENSEDLLECMKAGASGYLLKNIDINFLLGSILKAHEGDNVLSPEMMNKLVHGLQKPEIPNPDLSKSLDSLTVREKEVLTLLSKGMSNKMIAKALNLTESTIKVHVQNILRKLNLTSRVQAAIFVLEHQKI